MNTIKKQTHFPAINGLRGAFALAVLIAHINISWLPHAHILMDTFFSISAFLITLTLINNIDKNGTISLLIFTKRRLLRLYPALIFCVIFYTTAVYFIVDNFKFIINDAFLTLIYLSNFSKISNYVYPHLFAHTWSLAIEEQFYLIWPSFLALLMMSKLIWKYKIIILLLILASSIAWRVYLVNDGAEWSRLYYASDTRIDAFIAGGLLAFSQVHLEKIYSKSIILNKILFTLSLCMVMALYAWDPKTQYYFKWQQPIILFLSCSLIFTITRNDNNFVEKIFSAKYLQWLGLRCYGFYLWHWPIIWILISKTETSKPIILIIVLPFTLFMAWFSYKYIEEPILRRRPKIPNS